MRRLIDIVLDRGLNDLLKLDLLVLVARIVSEIRRVIA